MKDAAQQRRRGWVWGGLGASVGLWILLAVCGRWAWGDPATHRLPDQTRQRQVWAGDSGVAFVVSGCAPAVPVSSLTLAAFACEAYVKDSTTGEMVYAQQDAAALTLANVNGNHWVGVCRDVGSAVSGWTRVAGTKYVHRQTASQPADPSGCLVLAQVTVAAGVVSAVAPLQVVGSSPWTGVVETVQGLDALGVSAADTRINAALARAGNSGGGTVQLPRGRLKLTTSLRVPSGVTLQGAPSGTTLVMDGAMTVPGIVNTGYDSVGTNVNITLRDFTIEGGRLTPRSAFSTYANIWNPTTTYLAGQYVMHTGATSYKIYRADGNCTSGAGTGPDTTGTNIADGTCSWDFVERLWTNAVGSATPSDPILNTDPILLQNVTGLLIDNVTIWGARNDGIILELCARGVITRSNLSDVNKNAIYLSNVEHIVVSDNHFGYNYGDIAAANAWYSVVHGNAADTTVYYMIGVGRDAQFNSIVNNVGGPGSRFIGLNETITGTAHGVSYPGVAGDYLYGMYHSVVSGNVFQRMQLINSSLNLVSHNLIYLAGSELGGYPIWLSGSSQNKLHGNLVYSGTTWGIALTRLGTASTGTLQGDIDSVQNELLHNRILAPFDPSDLLGINVDTGSTGTVLENNVVSLAPAKTLDTQHYTITEVATALFRYNRRGTGASADLVLLQSGTPIASVGTFTVTGTGFASDPTASAVYRIDEQRVLYLYIPQLSGTSDDTSFTVTGIPAALTPVRNQNIPARIADNGTDAIGHVLITASNATLTIRPSAAAALWTGAGTKTLYALLLTLPLF